VGTLAMNRFHSYRCCCSAAADAAGTMTSGINVSPKQLKQAF